MSWLSKWSWYEMCGPDGLVIWSSSHKDIGTCFQELCLKAPTLTLLAAVSAYHCGRQDRWVERDTNSIRVILFRSFVTLLLGIEPIFRVCYSVLRCPSSMFLVNYLLNGLETFAWLVHFCYLLALRSRLGVSPRGPILVCVLWTINFSLNMVSVRSKARLLREGPSNLAYYNLCAEILSLCTQLLYLLSLIPGRAGSHTLYNRMMIERDHQRAVQSDERQALLDSPPPYSGFREEHDPHYLGEAMNGPTFSSSLFFHWVRPLMQKGDEGELHQAEDLFELPQDLSPSIIHSQLEQAIGRTCGLSSEQDSDSGRYGAVQASSSFHRSDAATPSLQGVHIVTKPVSLMRALHSCFGWEFYSVGILKFIGDTLGFAAPLLLNQLVVFIESKSDRKEDGYFYALGLGLVTLLSALCNAHFTFLIAKVGMKMRSAIVTLVYRKVLTLSPKSLSDFSTGQIVNFMSDDSDRIVNSCPSLHALWSTFLQLFVIFYLLYNQVGWACLSGAFFAVILIPINKLIAMKIGSLSSNMMGKKDERVELCSETLRGIRTLKMHVWEEHFLSKILRIRKSELSYLKGRKYLDALCVFFWATTPVIVAVLTFACYSLLGGQLTAARVFTTIALLNMLIAPLNAFPYVLNGLVEACVSLSRIQRLITLPDLELHKYYHPLPTFNEEIAVRVCGGKFTWGTKESVLTDIDFTVYKGQLVGVIGEVGSGKSTLLASILAESEKLSGVVAVQNSDNGVAYVAQHAWLQHGTIRDNILFGKPFDETRYRAVLEACCLSKDLEALPNHDLSGVAEGASNLSGGQKARIALARAVYQDKAIYIFDDILSSVDPPVAKSIFRKCILEFLVGRTRILCTHSIQCLRHANVVMRMSQGRIMKIGPPEEVLSEELENLLLDAETFANDTISSPKVHKVEGLSDPVIVQDEFLRSERHETGAVQLKVYGAYLRAITPLLCTIILLSLTLMQSTRNLADWWMSYWVSHNSSQALGTSNTTESQLLENEISAISLDPKNVAYYLTVYATIAALNSFFTLIRAFSFAYAGIHAATWLHKQLAKSIIRARASFYDISPTGRILNRLSSDTYTIDDSLPFILNILLAQLFGLLGTVIVTIYGLPWMCLVLAPLIPIYYWLQGLYRRTSRELKRIRSVTLSPLYSHFSESIQGLSTIRAFRASNRFKDHNELLLNHNQRANLASVAASQWLGLRLQLMGVFMISGVAFIAVIQHNFDSADPGFVGLAIAYALSVTGMLGGVVNAFTETEREMVAVERVHQYINDIQCEPLKPSLPLPYGWPSQGVVQFQNVVLKYREHLRPSLDDVCFKTRPSEKIGVVGRTGAGKSSLLAALFRLVEVANGDISIDSVNIANLNLHNLRSKLAIIPQDPFLFAGTVRENVDPCEIYHDHEVLTALASCQVVETVRRMGGLKSLIGSGGSCFSAGQKQLICLARAVLHNAKILCIDEATANVDQETDRLIQKTIRSSFRQSTVFTIAHRLDTIMDCDRVLVLGGGKILEFDDPVTLMNDNTSHFYRLATQEQDHM